MMKASDVVLTDEHTKKFPQYVDKWCSIGCNTEPCDVLATVEAIKKCYECGGLDHPRYFFGPFNNPIEQAYGESIGEEIMKEFPNDPAKANQEILRRTEEYFSQPNPDISNLSTTNQIYGAMDASWLSFYDYFEEEFDLEETKPLQGLIALSKVCGWWAPYDTAAFFQHRPAEIHWNEDETLLNNTEGPAIKFRGWSGMDVYCVNGVRVTKKIIDRDYTVEDIEKENNAEVRRVMIDLYGADRFIQDSNSELINEDDFGQLYRKAMPDDEDIWMVKVTNSTPEPDGSFKDYWIRVDPNAYGGLKTARQAVASTWRNLDENGQPGDLMFDDPDMYCEELLIQT